VIGNGREIHLVEIAQRQRLSDELLISDGNCFGCMSANGSTR
jgi:hypothetical protein